MGINEKIKAVGVDMLRDLNFELQHLANWASNILKAYGIMTNLERKSLDGLSPDLFDFIRLETSFKVSFIRWPQL